MPTTNERITQILAISAFALGLAACGPNDNQTVGQKLDNAIEKTEQAADKAKLEADRAASVAGQKIENAVDVTKDAAADVIEKTEQAADKAKVEADRAAAAAGQKIENAVDATKDAAANAAAATHNAAADALNAAGEAGTTAKVNAALVGDPELSALKIDVDTNGTAVTLTGEAPSQSAKDRATEIAKAVQGVTTVNNMLTVK